jgi:hypothetical protein
MGWDGMGAAEPSQEGFGKFVNSRIGTFFRPLRDETDGSGETVRGPKSLPACNFRVELDNPDIC